MRDYDEAIVYFTSALGFLLFEGTDMGGGKRWVRVAPRGGCVKLFDNEEKNA